MMGKLFKKDSNHKLYVLYVLLLTPCRRIGLDEIERPCGEIPETEPVPGDAHHQVSALAEDQLLDSRSHPVEVTK